jgi:hypothetical protein
LSEGKETQHMLNKQEDTEILGVVRFFFGVG